MCSALGLTPVSKEKKREWRGETEGKAATGYSRFYIIVYNLWLGFVSHQGWRVLGKRSPPPPGVKIKLFSACAQCAAYFRALKSDGVARSAPARERDPSTRGGEWGGGVLILGCRRAFHPRREAEFIYGRGQRAEDSGQD